MKKLLSILILLQISYELQTKQPITLFCHGIVDSQKQSQRFLDVLEEPIQSFNFPDAQAPQEWDLNSLIFQSCSLFGKSVNRNQMFMGHGKDVVTLSAQIDHMKEYILYGVSRGGSAAINYLAEYNPSNIKALILDATPADMISPIDTLQNIIGYKFAPNRAMQENIFNFIFPAYEINSISPVNNILNIKNKFLPIFIIHSVEDSKVSVASAWQLYLTFKNNGFTDVYLCQLEKGKHSFALQGPDKNLYMNELHSFYKKYHFNYNKKYANMDLEDLQPSIENIQKKLDMYKNTLTKIYETRQFQIHMIMALAISGIITKGVFYHRNLNQYNHQTENVSVKHQTVKKNQQA